MVRVTLDPKLEATFAGVDQAEICDAGGRTVGHYFSEAGYQRLMCDLAKGLISDEEIDRRLQQRGGRTTAAILADLEGR